MWLFHITNMKFSHIIIRQKRYETTIFIFLFICKFESMGFGRFFLHYETLMLHATETDWLVRAVYRLQEGRPKVGCTASIVWSVCFHLLMEIEFWVSHWLSHDLTWRKIKCPWLEVGHISPKVSCAEHYSRIIGNKLQNKLLKCSAIKVKFSSWNECSYKHTKNTSDTLHNLLYLHVLD